jgi:hypothetical protein
VPSPAALADVLSTSRRAREGHKRSYHQYGPVLQSSVSLDRKGSSSFLLSVALVASARGTSPGNSSTSVKNFGRASPQGIRVKRNVPVHFCSYNRVEWHSWGSVGVPHDYSNPPVYSYSAQFVLIDCFIFLPLESVHVNWETQTNVIVLFIDPHYVTAINAFVLCSVCGCALWSSCLLQTASSPARDPGLVLQA